MTVEVRQEAVPSRAHTPARVAPTRIGTGLKRVGSTTTAAASGVARLASRYAATDDAWAETPASIRACLDYTREGGWMPGDKAPWLEVLGKAYGYGVAVPCTVALFGLAWTVQKPSRLFLIAFSGVLVWLAAGWLLP
jgi:hypothetical protein